MTATMDITREHIAATEAVIRPYVRRTPVVRVDLGDFGLPAAPVTFKLEMLQHSGSFKARGAFANLLLRKPPAAGVVAASGGNHGVAVAYAAQRLGMPATIFVPDITSPAKLERIRSCGAQAGGRGHALCRCARGERSACRADRRDGGARRIDQAETMLGQGTVGMEVEQDAPDIDTLLVAVGGGGLIGGIAAWYRAGSASSRSSRKQRRHCMRRLPQACRSMRRPGGIAADCAGAARGSAD